MYIDDLVEHLNQITSGTYAYANDIAFLNKNQIEANNAIEFTKLYCRDNMLQLNELKCGHLFFNGYPQGYKAKFK